MAELTTRHDELNDILKGIEDVVQKHGQIAQHPLVDLNAYQEDGQHKVRVKVILTLYRDASIGSDD